MLRRIIIKDQLHNICILEVISFITVQKAKFQNILIRFLKCI